jgi:hypothetical protein
MDMGRFYRGEPPLGLGTFCVCHLIRRLKPAAIHGGSLRDHSLLRLRSHMYPFERLFLLKKMLTVAV